MPCDDLFESLEAVNDEVSFLRFVHALIIDRHAAKASAMSIDGFQGEWASQTIEDFLDAAKSWADDSDFGARPGPKDTNPWQLFATFLWAGRSYE